MPPLVLILVLTTVSFVSSKGYRIAATLFAVELGAGPLATGLLFALWGLFPFLLSVYAGRLADRFDNRVLMYWGLTGFSISLALPFVFPTLAALYVSAALGGFTSMLFVVATQNLVGVLSSADTRTRNFSFYSLGESSAAIAGPVIVGASIDAFRYPATFLLLAAINGLCLLLLLARRRSIPNAAPRQPERVPRSTRDLLGVAAVAQCSARERDRDDRARSLQSLHAGLHAWTRFQRDDDRLHHGRVRSGRHHHAARDSSVHPALERAGDDGGCTGALRCRFHHGAAHRLTRSRSGSRPLRSGWDWAAVSRSR